MSPKTARAYTESSMHRFVDPRTKEKIRFMEKNDATELIPPNQLQKIFGGEIDFEYVRPARISRHSLSTSLSSLTCLCPHRTTQPTLRRSMICAWNASEPTKSDGVNTEMANVA